MRLFLAIIMMFPVYWSYGQTHYSNNKDCFETMNDDKTVPAFKDKLTCKVKVTSLTWGKKIYNLNVMHEEVFEHETNLIRINDTIGLKISVARIIDYGRKKYLLKVVPLKYSSCWTAISTFSFTEYKLGTSNSMYGVGTKGNDDYFAVEGDIKVE